MTKRELKENIRHYEINKENGVNIWEALGFDNSEGFTTEEMLDRLAEMINKGEISPEQMKAALEIVEDE